MLANRIIASRYFEKKVARLWGEDYFNFTSLNSRWSDVVQSRFFLSLIIFCEYVFEFVEQYVDHVVLLYVVDGQVVGLLRGRPQQRGAEHYRQICRVHPVAFAVLCNPGKYGWNVYFSAVKTEYKHYCTSIQMKLRHLYSCLTHIFYFSYEVEVVKCFA